MGQSSDLGARKDIFSLESWRAPSKSRSPSQPRRSTSQESTESGSSATTVSTTRTSRSDSLEWRRGDDRSRPSSRPLSGQFRSDDKSRPSSRHVSRQLRPDELQIGRVAWMPQIYEMDSIDQYWKERKGISGNPAGHFVVLRRPADDDDCISVSICTTRGQDGLRGKSDFEAAQYRRFPKSGFPGHPHGFSDLEVAPGSAEFPKNTYLKYDKEFCVLKAALQPAEDMYIQLSKSCLGDLEGLQMGFRPGWRYELN